MKSSITITSSRAHGKSERTTLLNAVSSTGAGDAVGVNELYRAFQVVISDTATCKLQASIDGSNWIDLRTSTASEGYTTSEPWPFIRGNVTAHTSGTVTLLMAT